MAHRNREFVPLTLDIFHTHHFLQPGVARDMWFLPRFGPEVARCLQSSDWLGGEIFGVVGEVSAVQGGKPGYEVPGYVGIRMENPMLPSGKHTKNIENCHTMWCPQLEVYLHHDISPRNQSEIGVMFINLADYGAPP